ncbi:hypothetical protein FW774_13725 [Pedobacter sp. BS3]|uniref:putative type IX sorting system protein PorV2 n=1 Tax=Pedobacter sp. BS3 TaxID=2567937 RepID=UPI0011EF93E9|nr:hypothetical protein [Pedobacter sp. BS3]TZF82564.1 hypothetical protein FW774_13725 [Pedobacter sp. BS3]
MRLTFYLFFLFFIPLAGFAQQKYSNEFLSIGVGSQAFGMSQSVVASVNDVTAGYWNPAGLMRMENPTQASLMHSEYFAGLAKYDYAGFATAVADHTAVVGASIIRFAVDDIPDTSELIDADGNINYDRVKSFSSADYALILSYARRKKNNRKDSTGSIIPANGLTYGANAKIIHRKVGQYGKSFGFGIDIGLQYKLGKWGFAAVGRDITTTFNSWSYNADKLSTVYTTTGNDIPESSTEITYPRIILGTSYSSNIGKNIGLTGEVDLNFTTDGKRNVLVSAKPVSIDPTVGLEVNFKKIAYLRGGIGNIQQSIDFEGRKNYMYQPNMGVGVRINNVYIDYALTNVGKASDALYSNVFSLKLDLGK